MCTAAAAAWRRRRGSTTSQFASTTSTTTARRAACSERQGRSRQHEGMSRARIPVFQNERCNRCRPVGPRAVVLRCERARRAAARASRAQRAGRTRDGASATARARSVVWHRLRARHHSPAHTCGPDDSPPPPSTAPPRRRRRRWRADAPRSVSPRHTAVRDAREMVPDAAARTTDVSLFRAPRGRAPGGSPPVSSSNVTAHSGTADRATTHGGDPSWQVASFRSSLVLPCAHGWSSRCGGVTVATSDQAPPRRVGRRCALRLYAVFGQATAATSREDKRGRAGPWRFGS